MSATDPRRARVVEWIEALVDAGENKERAQKVLNQVRDDKRATDTDREHFYRALAQQSFLWYMSALKGSPLTQEEMMELMAQVEAARAAQGDAAAEN
jgi:hypothetical protein